MRPNKFLYAQQKTEKQTAKTTIQDFSQWMEVSVLANRLGCDQGQISGR